MLHLVKLDRSYSPETIAANTIGRDGHFSGAENIECADDQEAIQQAQQAVDGHDVELWERGRFTRLASKPNPK